MLLFVMLSCVSTGPAQVCARLESAGVAKDCRFERQDPTLTTWRFDLVGGGSHGMVYQYADETTRAAAYDARHELMEPFREHGQLPWHFDSREHRVTVMLVHGASEEARARASAVVEAL